MIIRALGIFMPKGARVGVLFQYKLSADSVTTRFVADEPYIFQGSKPSLSYLYVAESADDQAMLWADLRSSTLNGRWSPKNGWLLPAFFQNLLPEGVFRDRVAELRGCDPKDHFEMLAACGKDLPGGVYALPVNLDRADLQRYVTENNDALEASVVEAPMEDGVSLSGVQPKVAVALQNGRYVARTKANDAHIIAKLPVVSQPNLPEVEALSLRLAAAAGVDTCSATLAPLELLQVQHGYDVGDADGQTNFLAVQRFDRTKAGRIHCEDFAQVLGTMPEHKYGNDPLNPVTYFDIAAVLMTIPSAGEAAVHELLRRLVVNEMLGNPDMHLKNIGLLYANGSEPTLSPAYDMVAYSAYINSFGHALRILAPADYPVPGDEKQHLSPAVVRTFCAKLGIVEAPAKSAIAAAVKSAAELWPGLIDSSLLTRTQKDRVLSRLHKHPLVEGLLARRKSVARRFTP